MKQLITLFMVAASIAFSNAQPRFDALHPDVHDPVMAKGEDGRYYIFTTGFNVGVISSADLKEWRREPSAFKQVPEWAPQQVRGFRGHTWAPDISYHNGQWYLYYSCSSFGKNTSAIGLATNKTLNPESPLFKWEDQGMVIESKRGFKWNAIDPNLILDKKGNPWLCFGSFWDGIQLVKLSKKDFQTPVEKPHTIARRMGRKLTLAELNDVQNYTVEGNDTIEAGENAIEAPFIFKHGDYYYLFVSFDYCCRGERSTYKTVYGRSKKVTGPYLDKKGQPYLVFGSFWDGIQLIKLSKDDFKTPLTQPVTISRRYDKNYTLDDIVFTTEGENVIEAGENAVEAPFVYKHGKYYYLFVSFDYCCRGRNSTYKTVYGRSKKPTGPFVDKEGRRMDKGGGTLLYGPNETYYGVGHNAAYDFDGQSYFISHAYEKTGGAKLFLRPIHFDKDGWIIPEKD